MKKTYRGSCHCGAVRFEGDIDLDTGTSRCNCSICLKSRFWKAVIPAAAFRLLQGGDMLTEYQFGANIHHYFCKRCGVKTFGKGFFEPIGEFRAVNIACLDELSQAEMAALPIKYEDGRYDRWESAPADTRHL